MELRRGYRYQTGDLQLHPTDSADRYHIGAAAPITAEGDLMGCVLLLLEDGAVRPIIQGTHPLAQAADAHREMEASGHIGKILLTP